MDRASSQRQRSVALDLHARMAVDGVTIVIPNWNHEYLLPRAIESALRAVKDLREHDVAAQVLVLDDMSRDGSLSMLRQLEALMYGDGLRVLAFTKNSGLPFMRNEALLSAGYRYILFLDADNEVVPENVWHFYRSIVQTQAAVVYGNLIRLEAPPGETPILSNESFQARLLMNNYIDAFAMIDRLQVLDSGGYPTSHGFERGLSDWEFYAHMSSMGRRIVFVPLVLGIYHDLPESMHKQLGPHLDGLRSRFHRIYNQLGAREHLPMNTLHLRYHPDIGYL